MYLKIGTLNCQNNIVNRNGGITSIGIDNSKKISNYIQKKHYFAFGTQELTKKISLNLSNNLKNIGSYKLYGAYRYGNNKVSKLIDAYNENNAIITNREVIYNQTTPLPFIPNNPKDFVKSVYKLSIMPRIATGIIIDDELIGKVFVMNTHLDYQISKLQLRQLKYVLKLIKEVEQFYPVVLTGDFNMDINDDNFKEFIESLNRLNIKRVEVNEQTHPCKKSAIDHIFIPNEWSIEDAGIINDENLNYITDHKGVYTKVKVK